MDLLSTCFGETCVKYFGLKPTVCVYCVQSLSSLDISVIRPLTTRSTAAVEHRPHQSNKRLRLFTVTLALPLTRRPVPRTLQDRRHDRGLYGSRPADGCSPPATAPLRHGRETRPVLTSNSRPGELRRLVMPAIHLLLPPLVHSLLCMQLTLKITKPCPHWRLQSRLSPKSATTVAENGDYNFGDYSRQYGRGFRGAIVGFGPLSW